MDHALDSDHDRYQSRLYDRIAGRASGYRTTFDVRVEGLTGEGEFIVTVFAHLGLRDTVLDVGCGDGAFTLRLGHHSGRVIGVDLSGAMLRSAATNLRESGNRNVAFVLAGGQALPLDDECIDAVVSRRGPATSRRCLPEVPPPLRRGGKLMGLIVGERHCIEIRETFGRGQNWPVTWRPLDDMSVRLEEHGLRVLHIGEKETVHYYPTVADLQKALETVPWCLTSTRRGTRRSCIGSRPGA